MSKKVAQKAYVPPPQRILTSPESVKNIRSIVCMGLPDDLIVKEDLKRHFSQYGKITRTSVAAAKATATIHFADHKSASQAKLNGAKGFPDTFKIYWSQSVGRRTSTGSSTAARRVLRVPTSSNLAADPKEVEDELQSMQDQGDYVVPRRLGTQTRMDGFLKRLESTTPSTQSKPRGSTLMIPRPVVSTAVKVTDRGPSNTTVKAGSSLSLRTSSSQAPRPSILSASTSRPIVASSVLRPATTSSPNKQTIVKPVVPSSEASVLQEVLKRPALTVTDRIAALEARDKLLRLGRARQYDLASATRTEGTCPDMCPEKERYLREDRHQVAAYEQNQEGTGMNHQLAVKQYSRSSADQELPLPYELRPPRVLRVTMNHLLANIAARVDVPGESLGDWYFYLWDRTRAIRKDITQQELCDPDAVTLVEQCARFHISCSARLAEEGMAVFDTKINTENLAKCLQTLKHLYHDMRLRGVLCPNEPEFRAYVALLNLNEGDAMWEVQQLDPEVRASAPVQFAVQTYLALSHYNYVRFFKLVRSGGFLNAAILMRYFTQARSRAVEILTRALCPSGKANVQYPLNELVRQLGFEDATQAARFCELHGLESNMETGFVSLSRMCFMRPETSLPVKRAKNLVESQLSVSFAEVIAGCRMEYINTPLPQPTSSFDPTTGLLSAKARESFEPLLGHQIITETPPPPPPPVVFSFAQAPKPVDHLLIQTLSTNVIHKVMIEVQGEIIQNVATSVLQDWRIAVAAKKAASMCMVMASGQLIREVCTEELESAKQEEKARQDALEAMRVRIAKRQEMIHKQAEQSVFELTNSVVQSELEAIVHEEMQRQRELATVALAQSQELTSDVVKMMVRQIAKEELMDARAKWAAEIAALTERLRMKRAHRMLLRWREIALRARRLWQRVQDFPAGFSILHPAQQANEMTVHVSPKECRYPVPGKLVFKPEVREISTQSLPLLDMNAIHAHLKHTKKSVPGFLLAVEPTCSPPTWQVVVSVPSQQSFIKGWAEKCISRSPLQVHGGCCVYEIKGVMLRFDMLIGSHNMTSSHGVVLVCVDQAETAARLAKLFQNNSPRSALPVAILILGGNGELGEEITSTLQTLGEKSALHHVRTFSLPNRPCDSDKLQEAVQWVAGLSSPLDCLISTPLPALISCLQRTSMWASLVVAALPPSHASAALEAITKHPDACLAVVNTQLDTLSQVIESWKPEYCDRELEIITKSSPALPSNWNTSQSRQSTSKAVKTLRVPLLCIPGPDWNDLISALTIFCKNIASKPRDANTLLAWATQQILAFGADGSIAPETLSWPPLIESILQERLSMCDLRDPNTGKPFLISLPTSKLEELLSAKWCTKQISAIIGVRKSPVRSVSSLEKSRQAKKREVQEVSDKLESLLLGMRQTKAKFARFEAALLEQ